MDGQDEVFGAFDHKVFEEEMRCEICGCFRTKSVCEFCGTTYCTDCGNPAEHYSPKGPSTKCRQCWEEGYGDYKRDQLKDERMERNG